MKNIELLKKSSAEEIAKQISNLRPVAFDCYECNLKKQGFCKDNREDGKSCCEGAMTDWLNAEAQA